MRIENISIRVKAYLYIMHKNLAKTSRKHMTSLLVASITNIGHKILTLKTPSYSIINTFRLSPISLKTFMMNAIKKFTAYKGCLQNLFIHYFEEKKMSTNLQFVISIALVTDELFCSFLNNRRPIYRSDGHVY